MSSSNSSTSIHIDIALIPIYSILLGLLLLNLFNHRKNGLAVFAFACLFATSRLVGNILLVAACYSKGSASTIQNLYIGGVIVQSIGFGFLINAALSSFSNVVGVEAKDPSKRGLLGLLTTPRKLAHILTIVATVLLIVGMTSIDFTPEILAGVSPVDLGTEFKAGTLILMGIVILVGAIVFYYLALSGKRFDSAHRLTLSCLMFIIVPMLIRSGWLCYRTFGSNNYFSINVWVQFCGFVLQTIPELLIVLVYAALGLVLTHRYSSNEVKSETEISELMVPPYPYSPSHSQDKHFQRA